MSLYIYQLVELLILPNTSTNFSGISHQLSVISYKLSASLSAIRYFYQAEPTSLFGKTKKELITNSLQARLTKKALFGNLFSPRAYSLFHELDAIPNGV